MRIPTDVLIDGGWDRALARCAFASDLPAQILRRRSKGGINQFSNRLLDLNRKFVRDFLLDGLLVRERILDGRRLEICLSDRNGSGDPQYNEVLHNHLSIEAWLRSWQEVERRAAA